MSNQKPDKTPAPFCLRLSKEERARLEHDAGDMPLGAYVRSCLFDNPTPRKRRMKRPVKDHEILAQLLTKLGASRMANNLNQLAQPLKSALLNTRERHRSERSALELRHNERQRHEEASKSCEG